MPQNRISLAQYISGLPAKHTISVPTLFVLDIMHLPNLNILDLFIPLWWWDILLQQN